MSIPTLFIGYELDKSTFQYTIGNYCMVLTKKATSYGCYINHILNYTSLVLEHVIFNELSWVVLGPATHFVWPTFKSLPKKFPSIPANTIHSCHVGSHENFSSIKTFVSCSSKLPSCNPKVGPYENSRILKSHGLMDILLTCLKLQMQHYTM